MYPNTTNSVFITPHSDMQMGTHWYHPHRHGAVALQVSGGMAGLLIMEPSAAYRASLPADLAALCTCLAWVLRWLDVAFISPQRVTPAIVWSREQLERAPRSIPVLARSVCVRMLTTLYS